VLCVLQSEAAGNSPAPVHLARISNKSSHHFLAAALSTDGARVAFSDAYQLRVFDISASEQTGAGADTSGQAVSIARRLLPEGTQPAHQLLFAPDGRLLAATADGRVDVIDLDGQQLVKSFSEAASGGAFGSCGGGGSAVHAAKASSLARERQQPAVAALAASSSAGGWAAAAAGGQVFLYSLADASYAGRVLMPGEAATALAFSPDGGALAVATAGKTMHVFDTASRRPTPWMGANGKALQQSLDIVPGPILGLSFDPTPQVLPQQPWKAMHPCRTKSVSAATPVFARSRRCRLFCYGLLALLSP